MKAWVVAHAEGGEDVTERARRIGAAEQAHDEVKRLKAEAERLARRRSRYADLYADEELTREEYREKKRVVDAELARVDELLKVAQAREQRLPRPGMKCRPSYSVSRWAK
jgi:lysyl-tRNA synthetase class I